MLYPCGCWLLCSRITDYQHSDSLEEVTVAEIFSKVFGEVELELLLKVGRI